MLNIKTQSAFHFANNPQQSIYAFPTTAHTKITSTVINSISTTTSILSPSLASVSSLYQTSSLPLLPSSSSISSSSSSSSSTKPTQSISIAKQSSQKLSTGAIAGIAVGGSCFIIGLIFTAFLILLRRRNSKKNRLSIDNNKHQFLIDEKQSYPNQKRPETSSPTPLVNHNHFINPDHIDDEEEMFWNSPPIGTFHVISTYTQTLDDELYIQPGDKVQIYMEYDDGWCLGINLTRGGSRGVFPQHCINMERPL